MKKTFKLTLFIYLISLGVHGQSLLHGNIYVYKSDINPKNLNVVVYDTITKVLAGVMMDSVGHFIISSVPNEKIDISVNAIGCYSTYIKNIELNNDTLEFKNIPIFEMDLELSWDDFEEKKLLWGLIKYKKDNSVTSVIKNSKIPDNKPIYIKCDSSENDSILFEFDSRGKISIEYELIKSCDCMQYNK